MDVARADHLDGAGNANTAFEDGLHGARGYLAVVSLPVNGGSVLRDSLTDVYRDSPLFQTLRDTGQREGKCGVCEYQKIRGGSRPRACAFAGNYLADTIAG